ncbi:polysaccharide pyruvyl transferase family protein [Psychrobacter proteolyticus]|uniref:polysaccharide pyruvyl transferase family protein n=1 Tax=Psychrobacter proteolyticus TaxID=147825 RepID=UPI000E0BBEBA|nr:polysaccharide pyruvyl transferase family protein [Psychrobacter proteolyticus]
MSIYNNFSKINNYISIKTKCYSTAFLGYFQRGPLLNYCLEKNAGDSFNSDFIEDFFHKKTRLYYGGKRKHALFCGSILAKSNKNSVILGAGFISKEQSLKKIDYDSVIGVRGDLTAQSLLAYDTSIEFKFKADPGLLVKEVITPRSDQYSNTGLIGVIPHFIDLKVVNKILKNNPNYLIIDIKKNYKEVCKQILKCDKVLSSSLHGLIFSDAMNVPNTWVGFSDNVKGGSFKFNDYYSVMTNPQLSVHHCRQTSDLVAAESISKVSTSLEYSRLYEAINYYFSM